MQVKTLQSLLDYTFFLAAAAFVVWIAGFVHPNKSRQIATAQPSSITAATAPAGAQRRATWRTRVAQTQPAP